MNQHPPLEPDQAWFLWEKLNHFAEQLWDAYQDDFVQRCLEESRLPSLPDDLDDGEDYIPF